MEEAGYSRDIHRTYIEIENKGCIRCCYDLNVSPKSSYIGSLVLNFTC